jgi:hypothetical protein
MRLTAAFRQAHQRLRLARRGVVYGFRASPPVSSSYCVMADSSFGRLGHLYRLNGQALAYVYFEEELSRRAAARAAVA